MADGLTPAGIRARAFVVAERRGLATRCTRLRSSPPLTLRETADGLYVVGSAAGPLGGDDLVLDVRVAAGASLTVRSAGASVVLPGPRGAPSSARVDVVVEAGAALRWLPEPTIAVRACVHRSHARIQLEERASLVWRDELVLGRCDEEAGALAARLDIDHAGRPLLRNEIAVGPAVPSGLGPARAVGTLVVAGPGAAEAPVLPAVSGARAAVLPLDGPGFLVAVVADQPSLVRAVLDAAADSTVLCPLSAI